MKDIDIRPGTVAFVIGGFAVVIVVLAAPLLGPKDAESIASLPTAVADDAAAPAVVVRAAAPTYDLRVGRWSCTEEYGYHTIEGSVTNITTAPIDNILAVGTFYDGSGNFIKSDDALIEYRPLMPRQTSPFKVMTSTNPAIRRCAVDFKEFWGGAFSVKR